MNDAAADVIPNRSSIWSHARVAVPTLAETSLVVASALLTILAFPNFDLWFLAWIGLAPLLFVIVRAPTVRRAFVAGWLWGIVFFYGTCWWLTYPMIRYGHIRPWFAYPLFLLPVIFVALFPALFAALLSGVVRRLGTAAICLAPLIWVAIEWLRYAVTGQLWNAIGYSQAFHPFFIQPARWGGVYAVSLLILFSNAAVALAFVRRKFLLSIACLVAVSIFILFSSGVFRWQPEVRRKVDTNNAAVIVAIQPNVPMDLTGDTQQMNNLLERHLSLTRSALEQVRKTYSPSVNTLSVLIIWPESPMNFSYSRDPHLREIVGNFARTNHASVLLNSLEPGRNSGEQNSAVMVNEEGQIVARYDKIRLMPFGEYVPLPRWLPGASSVRAIVGDFTPGSSYTLMPLGALRAGVFICIEAAHPSLARRFTNEGADVLINISNDGYLGPTPVMRQHLGNAVFRAVENNRDVIRVTNTGISAYINANGSVSDQTSGFEQAVRTWTISRDGESTTFYSRHGDVFVYGCALITLGIVSASFMNRRDKIGD